MDTTSGSSSQTNTFQQNALRIAVLIVLGGCVILVLTFSKIRGMRRRAELAAAARQGGRGFGFVDTINATPPKLYEKSVVFGTGSETWRELKPLCCSSEKRDAGLSPLQLAIVIMMPSKGLYRKDEDLIYELGVANLA